MTKNENNDSVSTHYKRTKVDIETLGIDLENSLNWIRGRMKLYEGEAEEDERYISLINAQQRIAKSLTDIERIESYSPIRDEVDPEKLDDIISIIDRLKKDKELGKKVNLQAVERQPLKIIENGDDDWTEDDDQGTKTQ